MVLEHDLFLCSLCFFHDLLHELKKMHFLVYDFLY